MAVTFTKSISGQYFSSTFPDVEFIISGDKADVIISVDGKIIYDETLFPINGKIRLSELSSLITPYARQKLVVDVNIDIREIVGSGTGGNASMSATVIYCKADFGINGDDIDVAHFCNTHFLSILLGQKITAVGRLEFLHYLGTETAIATAYYADDSQAVFTPPKVQGSDKYTTIDVSPGRFVSDGKRLVAFSVSASDRKQDFIIDFNAPDCAPVLIFENSFGCDELAYCTGTHRVSPSYQRNNTYIEGVFKNYDIEETRTFKADTGILNTAMANWFDDLFRSPMVRVVNFYNGSPCIGKEIAISDSKSEQSNDDDSMPRFTFSYRYAQRNHNVVDLYRAGRIFDNTFDYTFN